MGSIKNFREVVKSLKHRRACAKLCPRCGSPELEFSTRFDVWLLPEQYLCRRCGYRGPIVMEIDREELEKDSGANLEAEGSVGASDSCNDSEP